VTLLPGKDAGILRWRNRALVTALVDRKQGDKGAKLSARARETEISDAIAGSRSADPGEIAHFAGDADAWWDEDGPFAPLHALNPVRLAYARDAIYRHFACDPAAGPPMRGLSLLDIGCGGGLFAEPMARLGAAVTGIDLAEESIEVARRHAEEMDLTVDYRAISAEALAATGAQYDVVSALEVIEHLADIPSFLEACAGLIRPGGLFIFSTINRTPASYALAIVGAEYVLRWVPRGSHDWRKFVKPDELKCLLADAGFDGIEFSGLIFDPMRGNWRAGRRLDVNYIGTARRK